MSKAKTKQQQEIKQFIKISPRGKSINFTPFGREFGSSDPVSETELALFKETIEWKMDALIQIIKGNPSITELSINDAKYYASVLGKLIKLLKGTSITTLNLSCNEIGDAGATALVAVLEGTSFTELNLSWNQIGDEGAKELAAVLAGTSFTVLILCGNKIGDAGAKELAAVLAGTSITVLSLSSNEIGDAGATALAAVLAGTSITDLYLERNKIGDAGATALEAVLAGTSITELYLRYNNIGDEVLMALNKICVGNKSKILDLFQVKKFPQELQTEEFYKKLYKAGSLIKALKDSIIKAEDFHKKAIEQFRQCGDIQKLDLSAIKDLLIIKSQEVKFIPLEHKDVAVDDGDGINSQDENGKTPLHYAVEGGEREMVEFLLTMGAKINIADKTGKNPIHYAVSKKLMDIAKILVASKVQKSQASEHKVEDSSGESFLIPMEKQDEIQSDTPAVGTFIGNEEVHFAGQDSDLS